MKGKIEVICSSSDAVLLAVNDIAAGSTTGILRIAKWW